MVDDAKRAEFEARGEVFKRSLIHSSERERLPYIPRGMEKYRCTRIRSDGERCRSPALKALRGTANQVCASHLSGRARAKLLDPSRRSIMREVAREGRYSAHLPTDLLANYEHALRDPDLIAMRDELALLDSRMQAMLAALTAGSTNALWDSLSGLADRAVTAADAATAVTDVNPATTEAKTRAIKALADCAYQLAKLCATAASTSSTWSEMYDLLDLRRRLTETEQKRLVNLNTVLSSDKALALVAALAGSIRKHVTDPTALLAISTDFSVILNASVETSAVARNSHAAMIPAATDPTIRQSDIDNFHIAVDAWDENSDGPPPPPPATRRRGRGAWDRGYTELRSPLEDDPGPRIPPRASGPYSPPDR